MADIDLNKLGTKSDNLPDNWFVTLVNPTTGTVAENMTVARFIELFTIKQPLATKNNNGLMGVQDRKKMDSRIISTSLTKMFDANTLKEDAVITAVNWANTPEAGNTIAVLEVITYSSDWVMQRYSVISAIPRVYIRSYYNGTTWGAWKILE